MYEKTTIVQYTDLFVGLAEFIFYLQGCSGCADQQVYEIFVGVKKSSKRNKEIPTDIV